MRYLIVYATTEGQTRKVCRFCAEHLSAQGHSVEMLRAADATDVELSLYDAYVLAGSVHSWSIQPELEVFAQAHAEALKLRPALFLVVSLAAAGDDPEDRADLERIVARFLELTGWEPARIEHVAGAFRFAEYDFFKALAMRWIAHRAGRKVDPHGVTEYTDWTALAAMIESWPPR